MPNNYYKFKSHTNDMILESKKYDNDDYAVSGWLDVANTSINLPIFRAIRKSFDYPVSMEKYGWILNTDDLHHDFMMIFGHNVMNLGVPKKNDSTFKRFEELMGYTYEDFTNSHEYFQYTVDGKEYIYKIFAVDFFESSTIYKFPLHPGSASLNKKEVIKLLKENNIYKMDVDVNVNDDILLLTTCTRMFGSDMTYEIVVSGRLLRSGEKIDSYEVIKSGKYDYIEKTLKGDD